MKIDIGLISTLDAEGDASVDFKLAKEHRRHRRKLRVDYLEAYASEREKQKYLELYTKKYRNYEKKMIGEAKNLLHEHGYTVKKNF